MLRGVVKKIVTDRGFGFIKSTNGADVFFHASTVEGCAFEDLTEQQPVEYELEDSKPGDKGPRASVISPA